MLKKTAGIVLSHIKYKDSSIIVRIFTRDLGLKGYLVDGVRSLGKGSKIALYQPLTLLDLVVYDKENSGLQRISEAKIKYPQRHIPFDMARTSLALFSTEIISRSILEGYQNEDLFDFLNESISHLDSLETNLSHFPLVFLLENARHLGFAPELAEGFLAESVHHPFSPEEISLILPYLKDLLDNTYHPSTTLSLPLRRKLLDHLVEFHAQHLSHPRPLKSLSIIRQLIG
ncbi:MAG: DNA repair protein RecO [Bacteroidetes bacterium]|nr:DNA repair protein RecO [Bacteroidota bacterium]MDA1269018.1 DNA repair protein RecO [Bacteroidota bacterium]